MKKKILKLLFKLKIQLKLKKNKFTIVQELKKVKKMIKRFF